MPSACKVKAWLSEAVKNLMLEKQKLGYLSHQPQSDQWYRDTVLVCESDWLESIIQDGEKESVFSFGLDSSYLRWASEVNMPVCGILMAGSIPTAVTGGAEDRVPLR